MTVKITLTPEIEARLKGEASRHGLEIDAYATKLIADHFPPPDDSAEETDDSHRGVSPICIDRPMLFTKQVNMRLEDLPKWKPQVIITRRVLAEGDDD
jgi:hypothetical protein